MSFFFRILEEVTALDRWAKRAIVLLVDILTCIVAVLLAYSLRVGEWILWTPGIAKMCLIGLCIMVPVFLGMRVYAAIFRYAGRGTLNTLLRAGSIYTVIFAVIIGLANFDGVPRTTGVIQPIVFIALVTNTRLLARFLLVDLLHRNQHRGDTRNVLIYGAGRAGQSLAHSIQSEPVFNLAGYVDDDRRLEGQSLDGVKVFHSSQLQSVIEAYRVADILLAMPGLSRSKRREIVDRLAHLKVHVQTLPEVKAIIEGHVSFSDIRELEIEDLLGRESVAPNELLLTRTVFGKTVLITGAGGSIGSELCRQALEIGAKCLIMFEVSEFALYEIDNELQQKKAASESDIDLHPVFGSILDAERIDEIICRYRPDTIFHAAAYKHVPLVEANPVQGAQNNVLGTLHVAESARRHRVANFILISTDKAVRPTNVMGASKRLAELVVQALADLQTSTKFLMVRFGNVLGSSGSVVPLFRAQIAKGGPITLTHKEVTRYFMTIPEAAQLVLQAAGLARGGEVFVLDMGEPVRIIDLARTMVHLSGLRVRDETTPDGDIAIEEIGLRPGEKLYEELLIGNDPAVTSHPRIMKAREDFLPWQKLEPQLAYLKDCRDPAGLRRFLVTLVPEFSGIEERTHANLKTA